MNGFSRFWGDILPLRWYMEVLFDQAVRGLPQAVSAQPFAILGLLALTYFGLAWFRLRSLVRAQVMPAPKPPSPELPSAAFGIGGAMFAEFRRVLGDQGAFGMIVAHPMFFLPLIASPRRLAQAACNGSQNASPRSVSS